MEGYSTRREVWDRDGVLVAQNQLDEGEIRRIGDACDHALQQMRAQSTAIGHTTTHISGFLTPEYYADRPDALQHLVQFASSAKVVMLLQELGFTGDELLTLRDVQYFHEPSARNYDGHWHRDGDDAVLSTDNPRPRFPLLRFRVALAPDDHLEYVPGSHNRPDTPEERQRLKGPARSDKLESGDTRIHLNPGDICLFDAWGIHRARYRHDRIRRTLDLIFGFGPPKSIDRDALRDLLYAAQRKG